MMLRRSGRFQMRAPATLGAVPSFEEEDSGEDLEETVSEEEVPDVAPVDPLVAQFGEDDAWYCNIFDFVRQEEEGGAMDPLDF